MSGNLKFTITKIIFIINKLTIYEKENKNHSPYFFKILLLILKFNVNNFKNKKNKE